ncbi:MAG: aromatic ring-hydroxylating dioxygenase subunit alpha [Rhodospirillaceae bacterium]|nr:aromatic ring-hydroxylating dioxygenase subunit alpha [Rhodospirillaceae bacterium]
MLINNWYVAARSSEVSNKPFGSRMLGLDFVLFRDADGKAHCLSDVCCHRGGALQHGQINNDHVACPYHGWEFNTGGACTKIPAMGDGVSIPKRARIDSYPVEERLGFIWVFLGDADEKDRPEIPMWFEPFLNAPDTWRVISYDYLYSDVNWVRLGENSTDTAHPSFVHKAFGNRMSPKANIVPIQETAYGARTVRERAAPPLAQKTGAIAKILPTDRKTTRVTLEFSMVGITEMLYQEMTTEITQVLFSTRTPIDEYNTKSYGFQARNFLMEPEHDPERLKGLLQAAREDHDIVRFVKPKLTPKSTTEEFLIESDGMELTYRRKAQEYARKFGAIDRDAVARQTPNQIMVIPSPLRKADPKGWVHKTVPLEGAASSEVMAAE